MFDRKIIHPLVKMFFVERLGGSFYGVKHRIIVFSNSQDQSPVFSFSFLLPFSCPFWSRSSSSSFLDEQ